MGRLTTHVLDTARGCPAAGLQINLDRFADGALIGHGRFITNTDGRVDTPLLDGDAMKVGDYELVFYAGAFFRSSSLPLPNGSFLDQIPVRFHIADASAHYHVPLLLSPYGYATYRGS